ncbi:HEPN domain-containing protein [Polynucleobacter sp. MWH-UH25E]|uniref:HEPN domain-containing protein n=1 Tax=Polynucleobacter sp. MWH-UH25E TaxID=1855616 RepID=UPI001BFD3388|nr:HEPN domain-containing protein [Polynucleobacter sp. MWH-UH25E]QWD62185.1 HEPN domain-containing protein [Polynucleobacter sp. MWH-UH25E]
MSPRIFTNQDGLFPKDLVRYGLDHIAAGFKLFRHPFHFDSAGYLIHIGYECLLKGWILELTGQFDAVHSIKVLTQQIPVLQLETLSPEFISALTLIDDYQHLRYPNRKEPREVGTEEMLKIKGLVDFTVSMLPDELCTTEEEAHIHKGGRLLMKKKISP